MKFFLGIANWAIDSRDKYDGNQTDKVSVEIYYLNNLIFIIF